MSCGWEIIRFRVFGWYKEFDEALAEQEARGIPYDDAMFPDIQHSWVPVGPCDDVDYDTITHDLDPEMGDKQGFYPYSATRELYEGGGDYAINEWVMEFAEKYGYDCYHYMQATVNYYRDDYYGEIEDEWEVRFLEPIPRIHPDGRW